MALICDTGAVYALYDADDVHHAAAKNTVEAEAGPLFLPTVLLAEIDYLLTTRLGVDAALEFLESIELARQNLGHDSNDTPLTGATHASQVCRVVTACRRNHPTDGSSRPTANHDSRDTP